MKSQIRKSYKSGAQDSQMDTFANNYKGGSRAMEKVRNTITDTEGRSTQRNNKKTKGGGQPRISSDSLDYNAREKML